MKFVRNVLHDLVEKKLWPVAVALLAAAAAVPFVLGGSSASSPGVAAVPAGTGASASRDAARGEVVSLAQPATGPVTRGGKVRNPFVQHHVPKATAAANSAVQTTTNLVNSLSGGSTPSSTGTPTGATGGGATPAPTTPTSPAKKPSSSTSDVYGVSLKFGEKGVQKTYNNVARLTPLPSSTDPFFVFLGLSDDGKSAVFLVDANAVPSGDGVCKPSADDCQQVVLKKGDIEFFDLQSGTAGLVQYQLEITNIHKAAASTASAAKAHARESRAGREYLRQVMAENPDALSAWGFSPKLGLLVSKDPLVSPDLANVPPDVAAVAAGQPAASSAVPALTLTADPQP